MSQGQEQEEQEQTKRKEVEKWGNHRENDIKQGEEENIENSPVESSPGDPAILKTSRSGN
jgi:hypothetical protein